MRVVCHLEKYQPEARPLGIALGNFDGVHQGHLEIFKTLRGQLKTMNGAASALTFEEHPQRVLRHDKKPLLITSLYQKLGLLQEAGLDLCFVLKFTEEFSKKSAEEFVKGILIDRLKAKVVCMGFNARFGHGRNGDVRLMKQLSETFSFQFFEVKPIEIDGATVSSGLIRKQISEGQLDVVTHALGRPYSLCGTVVPGSGRGNKIGFPTANLMPHSEIFPLEGVYAVLVDVIKDEVKPTAEGFHYRKKKLREGLRGVLNYGKRPTFKSDSEQASVLEVHLLDFHENLLGETLEIRFLKKIRKEEEFENVQALREQIQNDINRTRALFSSNSGLS